MTMTPAAELAALEAAQDAVETIDDFVARVTPKFASIPWHLRPVYDLFELSRYEEVFATISEPPRHGKTTSVATGLAYRAAMDPACLNFYATYGDNLSKATSRKVRKLTRAAGVPLSKEVANVHEWETPFGGGLKATSVGADVTGRGCNGGMIVADDIIKGRKAAESKGVRDDAWDWLRDDLMSRLEPGASMIVNATRWHEDDPIGRLMKDGLGLKWRHIVLPAVRGLDGKATDERKDPHARALWPEGGYDLARLAKIRMRGEHGWWSLYQQKPTPKGGGKFKLSWFNGKFLDYAPITNRRVRVWDVAASSDATADYTVGTDLRIHDGKLAICDIVRGQWEAGDRDAKIKETAHRDGPSVRIVLPQDPAAAGKAQKVYWAQQLHGFTLDFYRPIVDKETAADPVVSQAMVGNVEIVRGPWLRDLMDELENFPRATHDDQVDTLSAGYAALLKKPAKGVPSAPILGG